MSKEQIDHLKFIIFTYGAESQKDMAIEECSELTKAILKERRGKGTEADIIDEIADVLIMCEQLKIMYDCESAVNDRIDFKIKRQLARIGGV